MQQPEVVEGLAKIADIPQGELSFQLYSKPHVQMRYFYSSNTRECPGSITTKQTVKDICENMIYHYHSNQSLCDV